jgi:hypothetical protein
VEPIERRTAWLAISVAIVLPFDASGAGIAADSLPTWKLLVYLAGIFSLGAAGVLLVCALAPSWFRSFELAQRERFAFFAFVFFGLAILAIVTLSAQNAIHAHNHPSSFG